MARYLYSLYTNTYYFETKAHTDFKMYQKEAQRLFFMIINKTQYWLPT